VISPTQRPVIDNTQHSHPCPPPRGTRILNPRKREASDPRISQRDHWDRLGGMVLRGNWSIQRKTCPSATSSITNPTCIGLGLNPTPPAVRSLRLYVRTMSRLNEVSPRNQLWFLLIRITNSGFCHFFSDEDYTNVGGAWNRPPVSCLMLKCYRKSENTPSLFHVHSMVLR